jgi:ElaB/YqjD/DUF883 family membrane-anchored ribosome-binding protein
MEAKPDPIPGTSQASQYAREKTADINRATKQIVDRGAEVFDQTKQAVSAAYGKTSEVLSHTYDQAMVYGRENPGKMTLIAFGAGIGIGALLMSGRSSNRRAGRFAEPVVNALSEVALEFFRHR